MTTLAKILLGVGGAVGAFALLRSSSKPPTPVDTRPPGEQVNPGDRFEADLSFGVPELAVGDPLRVPGQILTALQVFPLPGLGPRTSIQSRHEATGRLLMVPVGIITRKL